MPSHTESKPWFSLSGIFLSIIFLLVCSTSTTAVAEESVPDMKYVPCQGLKPFNNLDELLYQFYINLDSDCMFKMSVAELQDIWGIKILSQDKAKPEEYTKLRLSSDFKNKPYKSEKDAFYLEILPDRNTNSNIFYIPITSDYYKEHATLFPNGNYPRLLPEPLKLRDRVYIDRYRGNSGSGDVTRPKTPGKYYNNNVYTYYWLNSNQTKIIILSGINGSVESITIKDAVSPSFINKVLD